MIEHCCCIDGFRWNALTWHACLTLLINLPCPCEISSVDLTLKWKISAGEDYSLFYLRIFETTLEDFRRRAGENILVFWRRWISLKPHPATLLRKFILNTLGESCRDNQLILKNESFSCVFLELALSNLPYVGESGMASRHSVYFSTFWRDGQHISLIHK